MKEDIPEHVKRTHKAITTIAFEAANKAFDGKSNDISLRLEDGSIRTLKLEKKDLFVFIYDKYWEQYEEFLHAEEH